MGAAGPLRAALAQDPPQLPQGPLAGWPSERDFAQALVRWASALQRVPGSGQVTYTELALTLSPTAPGRSQPSWALGAPGRCCR